MKHPDMMPTPQKYTAGYQKLVAVGKGGQGLLWIMTLPLTLLCCSQNTRHTEQITLSCEPQELPLLQSTTMSELKKLQEEGPRPEEIRGAVEADRRDRETAERTNAYWLHRCVCACVLYYLNVLTSADVDGAVLCARALNF